MTGTTKTETEPTEELKLLRARAAGQSLCAWTTNSPATDQDSWSRSGDIE